MAARISREPPSFKSGLALTSDPLILMEYVPNPGKEERGNLQMQRVRNLIRRGIELFMEIIDQLSDAPALEGHEPPEEERFQVIRSELKPYVPDAGFLSISRDEWEDHKFQRTLPEGLSIVYEKLFHQFQELGLLPLEEYFSVDPVRIQSQIEEVYWRIVHGNFLSQEPRENTIANNQMLNQL